MTRRKRASSSSLRHSTFLRTLILFASKLKSLTGFVESGCSSCPCARASASGWFTCASEMGAVVSSDAGQPSSIQLWMKMMSEAETLCPPHISGGNCLPSKGNSPFRPLINPDAAPRPLEGFGPPPPPPGDSPPPPVVPSPPQQEWPPSPPASGAGGG